MRDRKRPNAIPGGVIYLKACWPCLPHLRFTVPSVPSKPEKSVIPCHSLSVLATNNRPKSLLKRIILHFCWELKSRWCGRGDSNPIAILGAVVATGPHLRHFGREHRACFFPHGLLLVVLDNSGWAHFSLVGVIPKLSKRPTLA
jgi:hypothetical protein